MPTKTVDPDLAMTEQDIAAILADAQADAEQTARAVDQAEATARGEAPSAGLAMKAADITPAALTELRTAADLAAMRVEAAEKRVDEIRGKQLLAHQAAAADRVREQAAADLDSADGITAALDAFEAALHGLYGAMKGHNERVTHWSREMATAQVPRNDSTAQGPLGTTYRLLADGILVNGKHFQALPVAKVVLAAVRQVMSDDVDVTHLVHDWVEFPGGPVDVRARIRRDA